MTPCMDVTHAPGFIALVDWIDAIPFEEWPQQHRIYGDQLRPAMVNLESWHGFGEVSDALVALIMRGFANARAFNRMLSVVMPRDGIHRHRDHQQTNWITRIHVPLATNPRAIMKIGGDDAGMLPADEAVHMEYGHVYTFDTRELHSVRNEGHTPRIHFMFDIGDR